MKLTIEDTGDNTVELMLALDFLANHEIEVGIFESNFKDGDDLTVYGKAVVNEYGAKIEVTDKMRAFLHHNGVHLKEDTKHINIPERSFIRASYDRNESAIVRSVDDMLWDIVEGKLTAREFMSTIGENSVRMIRKYIQSGVSPSNAPLTLANKKQSTPLIDTTELINSLDWRIVDK